MTDSVQEATAAPAPEVRRPPRIRAAIGLFFLAPLVGEFLLGNLPITWLWALISLAPLYGGGALLIRETARRLGVGWPGIVLLGLSYAVVEEAFVTASLFNPDYVGLRLLDYGYLPALGIGAWWTVFVLTLHTVWSTAVPIALVEALVPSARRTPWLGWKGLTVVVLLFAFGCVSAHLFQQPRYVASTAQYLVSGVLVVLLVVLATRLRAGVGEADGAAPTPLVVGSVALACGSAFMGLAILVERIAAALNVAGMLAVSVVGAGWLWAQSRRAGWGARHELAAAAGPLLTYVWYSFVQVPSVGGVDPMVDAAGNAVLAVAAVVLLGVAWRRVGWGARRSG